MSNSGNCRENFPAFQPNAVREWVHAVHAAPSGGVLIAGRGDSTSWVVSAQVVGANAWTMLGGGATGKGADFVYPIANDSPVELLVRVHLKKNNADYGHPSEPSMVTVNP
ncbi:MAG: hypothetical protein ABIP78_06630 [Pyrinomonadaceae bacterium]